jgi:nucleoid-associated protein YgaU
MRRLPHRRVPTRGAPHLAAGWEGAMGNFEKLSVLVIVVIIVMILVVALYTWTDNPDTSAAKDGVAAAMSEAPRGGPLAKTDGNFIVIPTKKELATADKAAPAAGMGLDPLALQTTTGGATAFPAPISQFGAPIADLPKEAAKPAEPKVHEVVAGDNLTKIAKKYYGAKSTHGIALLRTVNSLTDESVLRVGQKLTIPELRDDGKTAVVAAASKDGVKAAPAEPAVSLKPGSLYTVKSGDTLPRISKRTYGTADKWHEIWLANFNVIDDPERVAPGTRLKLPM